MDRFRYYDICLRDHVLCNPSSIEKFNQMIALLNIPPGGRLLDIACGKAEFLIRSVERYGCAATGVDISQYALADARRFVAERIPDAQVELIETDGSIYDGPYASFDAVSCLGASWIWQGHKGTLRALARWARPGGYVLVGEPYWLRDPEADYLQADDLKREDFGTHFENVQTGAALGLTPVYTAVSSLDDWDHYEALQWYAAERWLRENPDEPDRAEIVERPTKGRDTYLRWGRDTLGWALYLFRK